MINRFYYTLDELKTTAPSVTGWNELLLPYTDGYNDSQYTTMLYNDVKLNYGDEYILYIDIEAPAWENIQKPTVSEILITPEYKKQVVKFMNKIRAWLDDSRYKYEKLISIYDSASDALMDDVKTESSIQFNDTPQNGGDFSDDNHTSTYTKNKSSSQVATKMARLEEIRNLWSNIYEQWMKEFATRYVIY